MSLLKTYSVRLTGTTPLPSSVPRSTGGGSGVGHLCWRRRGAPVSTATFRASTGRRSRHSRCQPTRAFCNVDSELVVAAAGCVHTAPLLFLVGLPSSVEDTLRATFGGLTPVVSLVLVLWINGKINEVRREQEAKAAAAAGKAISEGTQRAVSRIPPEQWQKLALCIVIDVLGDSSFALPGIGELSDVAFAPLEAYLLSRLFRSNVIGAFGAIEEGLPFTDAIPTATLAWVMESFFADTWFGRRLGLTPLQERGVDVEGKKS